MYLFEYQYVESPHSSRSARARRLARWSLTLGAILLGAGLAAFRSAVGPACAHCPVRLCPAAGSPSCELRTAAPRFQSGAPLPAKSAEAPLPAKSAEAPLPARTPGNAAPGSAEP